MNIDYQKKLDLLIEDLKKSGDVPALLLHSCCAPCSSYILEYLSGLFEITVFYHNPNIHPREEYQKRLSEQKRLIAQMGTKREIGFIEGEYVREDFYTAVKGLESEREGGARCFECYELRLRETAALAAEKNFDYFTTTLSVSPYKNALKLNEIGERLSKDYGVKYLYSDFKKKDGYKRSIELSRKYGLYRQDYCGCVFSRN